MGLGQYNSLGEYCGPHTASSVFLILITHDINLKSRGNINRLKNKFSMLIKRHASLYYPGCLLLGQLPDDVQKAESRHVFKNKVKNAIQ